MLSQTVHLMVGGVSMRCLSIAAAAVISAAAFTQIAFAADLPRKAPVAAPIAPPAYSWSGWYAGYNAGGGWSNNDGIDNVVTSTFCNANFSGCTSGEFATAAAAAAGGDLDTKPKGFIGGGQIGYNFQAGQAVYGIEADFQGASIKGSATAVTAAVPPGFAALGSTVTIAGTGSQKIDFLGTLRGRLGWTPSAPWLLYVTGGLAYGHTETSVSFAERVAGPCACGPFPTVSSSNDVWRAGWTVGGGLEWMFAPRWSLKGEYLYYDLGHVTVNTSILQTNIGGVPFFGVGIASTAHYNGSIARAGINYHF